jgi:hypothetical protein
MKSRNIFKKYFFSKSFLLLVFIFFINFFLRKTIPESYSQLLGYNQLYYDKDKVYIDKIDVIGDSLQICFEGGNLHHQKNSFRIFVKSQLVDEREIVGKALRLKPTQAGTSSINILINRSVDSISLKVDYSPDSQSAKRGNTKENLYEVTANTNVLINPGRLYSVEDWRIDFSGVNAIGISEKTAAMLRDSIKIESNDQSEQKILKIADFILARTEKFKGRPDDSMSGMNPLQQLSFVQAGKSKIWCGNYAAIFSFFASAAGLPVRLVSCGQSYKGYSIGIHVFCEVYMKEYQSWAFVDLMSGNILVRYNKKWLNSIDIQRLLRYDSKDTNLIAYHYANDSLSQTPFFRWSDYLSHYFYPDNSFTFYYGDFLKIMVPGNLFDRGIKFFYTKPYYAMYSDNQHTANYLFYLRVISNYLLAIAALVYLIEIIFTRIKDTVH